MTTSRLSLVLFSAVVLCNVVEAVTIDNVSPSQIGLGDEITITGSGFSTAKPKLSLVATSSAKGPVKAGLKLVRYDDSTIVAALTKVRKDSLGNYALSIAFGRERSEAGELEIKGPEIAELVGEREEFAVGEEASIAGRYFGYKKPTVVVGGAKVKIVYYDSTTVKFIVSKKSACGAVNVTISNKAGSFELRDKFQIVCTGDDPPSGGGSVALRIGADELVFNDVRNVRAGPDRVSFQGSQSRPLLRVATFIIPVSGLGAQHRSGPIIPPAGFILIYTEVFGPQSGGKSGLGWGEGGWDVDITVWDGKRLAGTFRATLRSLEVTGDAECAPTLEVSGEFDVVVE
jgi:hypothetical protein